MAWNPSPKVADCRDIARKWGGKQQVIIIAIDGNGQFEAATYGETKALCACAGVLGDAALKGIINACNTVAKAKPTLAATVPHA